MRPEIDGGRFPIKRTVGERVEVIAEVFADGHDVVAALLRDRRAPGVGTRDSGFDTPRTPNPERRTPNPEPRIPNPEPRIPSEVPPWRETRMSLVAPGTDEWTASFDTTGIGWHEYQIVAWVDRFLTWQRDIKTKADANQDVSLELLEGAVLIREAAARAVARRSSATARDRFLRATADAPKREEREGGQGRDRGAAASAPEALRRASPELAGNADQQRRESPALRTDDKWYAPLPTIGIDSRGGGGPAWSPDGTKMAAIYEGTLAVWPVAVTGQPLAPPRHVTSESAHSPSWAGDSRHILYQSLDTLRIVDIETGETRTVPLDLKYTPAVPTTHLVVHAGKLVDMKSPTARANVDVVIDGNRITSVVPHADANHSGQVVDASNLSVMPGLTEFHSHLQPDFGEAQGRAFLAFGVTTVRSPGNTPYEAVEEREANEAGVRPGPRVYGTGYLMEWQRVYYKMGVAISSVSQFEMELQRAKVLQHDLIKSYVRLPDLQQKRMVEFAHSIGVPVATHEIYPAALVGVDNTEHTAATSRRGYSPKMATLSRAYEDVVQLFGTSQRILCPMISGVGARRLFDAEPELRSDPRFKLYPAWIQAQVTQPPAAALAAFNAATDPTGGSGKMVIDIMRAGGLIVAGTDTPNAVNLHGELMSYVLAGMTPFEALKAATVNPAKVLNVDTGTIEAGKLADLVVVVGDPLQNIANAHRVKRVIANGRLYEMNQLLGAAPARTTSAGGQ